MLKKIEKTAKSQQLSASSKAKTKFHHNLVTNSTNLRCQTCQTNSKLTVIPEIFAYVEFCVKVFIGNNEKKVLPPFQVISKLFKFD